MQDVRPISSEVVDLLLAYPEPEARLRDVLLDQHVMCGVGNVYRCEVLWATELSPWAHVGDLTHADAVDARQHRGHDAAGQRAARVGESRTPTFEAGSAVYGRNGQGCVRCHETIAVRTRRRARPDAVLVPGLPGPPRPAASIDDVGARWTRTRRRRSSSHDLPWRTRDAS